MTALQMPWRRLAVLVLLCAALGTWAVEPTTQPLPRVETGMHTARITRMATDADGRWAVTASEDKTARVWDVATGRLLTVLRPPQDVRQEGRLDAVAMSPAGDRIALAGHTGADWDGQTTVYLFERAGGRLLQRLAGLPEVAKHLAYSPHGHWLAATLYNGELRLFDTRTGQTTARSTDCTQPSYSVHFSPDSRSLATTCHDGRLRVYAVDGNGQLGVPKSVALGAAKPFAARYSRKGEFIAVGFGDAKLVQVLAADTLAERVRPSMRGIDDGYATCVDWSADGRQLLAGGFWWANGQVPVRRWSADDWSQFIDLPLSLYDLQDLVRLPDGGWLFATQGGSWGAIGADGSLRHRQDALSADLAGAARLQLADGGRRVRFSLRWWPEEARVFSLPQGSLGPDEIGLTPPLTGMTDRFRIEDWQDRPNTRLNGVALAGSWPDEKSFSLAIAPDARHFALGSQFQLRLFDRQGRFVWRVLAPGVARAVNIASGSDLVVAAFGDGTIRWYRLVDGTELLALLPLKDGQRWIAWTPEGFYASSGPDAEALMGYHLNRGRDREGRFVNARQLRAQFYQPTLIAHRLDADGDALLANAVAHLGDVRTLLAGTSAAPPQVELLSPAELTSEGEVTVTVRVTDQGGGIGPLRFYIDGKPQSGRQGGSTAGTEIRSFSLEPGRRGIEVAGTSRGGVEGPRQAVLATVTGPSQEAALHVLAVGVQRYAPPEPELKHSAADATRFAQELAAHAKPLFRRGVFVAPVLVDPQATLDGIEQAFQALRAGIRPQDTLVIFLAGHGEAPLGRGYTFLPSGFRRGAQGDAGKGIDEQRLLGWLAQSPGRHTLLLLDTCDAGGAVAMIEGGYQRLSTLSQQVVIGASRRGQFAQEGVDGHGVFTAALLRVLNARQPDGADPVLRVARLRDDVESEVGRIVRSLGPYRQQVSGFLGSANFPLALR